MTHKQAGEYHLEGRHFFQQRQFDKAILAFRKAIQIDPNPLYYTDLAACFDLIGERNEAIQSLQMVLRRFHQAKTDLASLIGEEHIDQNHEQGPKYFQSLNSIMNLTVPFWHFPMLHDAKRNEAYKAAIDKVVEKGDIVLDIGTGTGLLAMLAVKAGAKHVYTCEVVPEIAAEAKNIIARNGMDNSITVLNKHSTDIQIPADMPDKADVLLSELISGGLLEERTNESVTDARNRLLKESARMVPVKGSVRTALVGGQGIEEWVHAPESIFGLKVDSFNKFRPLRRKVERHIALELFSDIQDVYSVDFQTDPVTPENKRLSYTTNKACRVVGLAQWIGIDLTDSIRFENRPPQGNVSHWPIYIYPLASPIEVQRDEVFNFDQVCDHSTLWFNPK